MTMRHPSSSAITGEGVGEDESYFVSMTDMLVGMLFIFIIILMAFALNLKEQETKIKQTTDRLTSAYETRTAILNSLKKTLDAQGIDVSIDERNGILRMPERLLFRRGEHHVDEGGRIALGRLAQALSAVLPCYAVAESAAVPVLRCPQESSGRLEAVYIEGHTDDVPFLARAATGVASNWDLSVARAISVYQQLLASAPTLDALKNDGVGGNGGHEGQKLIGVSGYAEFRPIEPNVDERSRAANRRIDLRFLMATPPQEEVQQVVQQVQQRMGTPP